MIENENMNPNSNQSANEKLFQLNIFLVFKDLIRNALLIIMAGLIGFLSVTVYAKNFYTSTYTTSSTLVVSAKSTTYANAFAALSTASSMAGVLKEVFESDVLKEAVSKDIGEVPKDVTVTANVISGTNLLVLMVTANDPKMAYLVSNNILKHYNEISDYLFSNAVLEVLVESEIPTTASNWFNWQIYRLLAAVGCAGIVAALIVLLCIIRKTFKNIGDAQERLNGKYIGVVPHERKNKTIKSMLKNTNKSALINAPVCSFLFEESNKAVASSIQFSMEQKNHRVLLVTSVAENEGKSTIATNIALSLVAIGKKVLIIDVDFRKPALYKVFDYRDGREHDIISYMDGDDNIEDIIIKNPKTKLDVILNTGAKGNANAYITSPKLPELIGAAREMYDFIILDTSPAIIGTDVQQIANLADCSVVVVRHDYVKLSFINKLLEDLDEAKSECLGYILNDYRGFTSKFVGESIYGNLTYSNYKYAYKHRDYNDGETRHE